jgi:hypothetical protein
VQTLLDAEQQDFINSEKLSSDSAETPTPRLRDESVDYPCLDAAIRQWQVSEIHPRLLIGLRGVLIRAGQKTRQLAHVVQIRSAGLQDDAERSTMATDAKIYEYLKPLYYSYRAFPNLSFMSGTAQVARFFSGQTASVRFPEDWFKVLQILSEGTPERLWSTYCTDPASKNWVSFAEAWSESPYLQLPGWFRIYFGDSSNKKLFATEIEAMKVVNKLADGSDNPNYSLATPYIGKSSRFLISKNYQGFDVLEYSPDGSFEVIPDLNVKEETVRVIPPSVWTKEAFQDFIKLAKDSPLLIPAVDLLQSIAEAVKASAAEVALIWFGLPNFDTYSSNFMPAHLREGCKLKTRECSAAKESLKALPAGTLKALVRSVVGGDPKDLWENPPTRVAERLKAAWGGNKAERIPLPLEWVEKLGDAVAGTLDKHRLLQALNAPQSHPLLSHEGVWSLVKETNYLELACHDARFEFREDVLQAATVSMAMLAYHFPVGDVARNKIGEVYQAVIKALANPGLLLKAGIRYEYDPARKALLAPLVESIFGKPKKQDTFLFADDGVAIAGCTDETILMAFRPAAVTTNAHFERLVNQSQALYGPTRDLMVSIRLFDALTHLQIARSAGFAALAARLNKTPVPHGSFEMNPILSADDVVKQVVRKYQVSEEAAAYYLQVLTLPDPTDKNVALWNGWAPAKLKKVAAELLDKKLVLEAARSRAGRKYFLPGGWEDLKAPHLPIETWKLPLFQIKRDAYQRATPPLGRILPLEPVHTLFEKAWKRIIDGDVPKYDEVK